MATFKRFFQLRELLDSLDEDDAETGKYDREINEYNRIVRQFPKWPGENRERKTFSTQEEAEAFLDSLSPIETTVGDDMLVRCHPRGRVEYSSETPHWTYQHNIGYYAVGGEGGGHWWIRWLASHYEFKKCK